MLSKTLTSIFINILLILIIGGRFSIQAQELNQWSFQQRIQGYEDETKPPVLIADQNRTVHAFTSQWVGSDKRQMAVIYNQWTLDQGWSNPIDIILSPIKQEARLLDVFLDKSGRFHIIFFGGDNTQANIYHTKVPALEAGNARAWSEPALVGEKALDPENGAIVGDNQGNIVIIYGGNISGNGIYAVYSTDWGDTWSKPQIMFFTNDDQHSPFDTKIYKSESGEIYSVWTVYNIAGQGESIHFSKLDFDQREWSNPLVLAEGSGLGVSHPTIIDYKNRLIITYYNSNANALWMIESIDEGQTWSEPIRISESLIGRNGATSLVVDSNNVLHILFGQRRPGAPDIHGIWHMIFVNDQLSPEEAVVSGPLVEDLVGDNGFDPGDARAVISQGNLLLVTWRTDPGNGKNGVWYSYTNLNAQELPLVSFQNQQNLVSSTPTSPVIDNAPAQANSSKTELRSLENENMLSTQPIYSSNQSNQLTSIFIGLIPLTILLIAIFMYKIISHNTH